MKCTNCGENLNITPGKSANFCPNCGNKIVAKTEIENIDTLDKALIYIVNNFGVDVLLGNKIVTYFSDITKSQLKDEKGLIKILSEKGSLDCLKEAINKPETEQHNAIKRGINRLPFAKAEGEDMLYIFAAALGWKITKPQPTTPQPVNELKAIPKIGSIYQFANIDWRVLDIQNNKALLISEKILEERPYNVEQKEITWENCTLRKYLNGEFYNKLGAAKSAIAETSNNNPNNQWYGTAGGNATMDKVFLLSLDEVCRYFGDSTATLSKKGSYNIDDKNNTARIAKDSSGQACWWWLRSPGFYSFGAAYVNDGGGVYVGGIDVDYVSGGVRPALWINL